MREKRIKCVIPVYAVGLLWVVYALFLPMYRITDFIILIVLSAVLYLGLSKAFPGSTVMVEEPVKKPQTGDRDVDALIAEGYDYWEKLKRANDSIPDPKISAQISRMENATKAIFDMVARDKSLLPQIRKFMNYYLPTTLKMLDSYHRLSSQRVRGANIDETLKGIENILETITAAFERQLDSLFRDEALDISTDIVVMEAMLKKEGL